MSMTGRDFSPDDISFDEWVRYVFDHPVAEREWSWDTSPCWNSEADVNRTLSHLTQLFERPAILMEHFSRGQINQGLYYIVNNSCSSHMHALRETSLPWTLRRRCFDAMITLFRDLMAPLYGNELGHLQKGPIDRNTANIACYMWWDVIPLYGGLEHPELDLLNDAVLHVCEEVLKLDAESCLESALHGLGHWHFYLPQRTTPIVRRFLDSRKMSPALREYALLAECGGVL